MKLFSLVLLIFLVACRFNHSINQASYNSEIDSFKLYCDTIPNIILPFHSSCPCGSGIPTDKEFKSNFIEYDKIKENKYIPKYGIAIGKIIERQYVLIAYSIPTDGTSDYIRTFTMTGQKIDELSLFHTDCGPSISDYENGYVSFDKDMKINQIDSVFKYKKAFDGKDIEGLPPYLAELRKFKYQISDSGKFVMIK